MRVAELTRTLENLSRRASTEAPFVQSFRFKSLPGFAETFLKFDNGFLVICGGTGVGKTALLELLWSAVRSSDDPPPRNYDRLGNAEVEISVKLQEDVYECCRNAFFDGQTVVGFPAGARYVGLEMRTADVQIALKQNDYDVLKEGAGVNNFDKDLLGLVSLVCGKKYETINFFECEVEAIIVPLFEAVVDGVSYDSRSMATGELSAFYIAWSASTSNPNSILLIEEPEAYLPPHSHAGIMGLIAKYTLKLKLCTILTTHSPTVAAEVPEKSLVSIRRVAGQSVLPSTRESKIRVLSRLGLQPKKLVVLFVEDRMAHDVLRELLSFYEFDIICKYEIKICDQGAGDIKNKLQHAPQGLLTVSFIGLLDGDMKSKASKWKLPHPHLFLPFQREMEIEFLQAAKRDMKKVSKYLERNQARVEDAFAATEGKDLHDQFLDISKILGLQKEQFTNLLLRHWVKQRGKRAVIKKFVRNVADELSLPFLS